MELKSLLTLHDFDVHSEALGRLRSGSFTYEIQHILRKKVEASGLNGIDFTRDLLRLVCKRQEESDNKTETLTEKDVRQVTSTEIENFANDFINHNKWLLQAYSDNEKMIGTNNNGPITQT